jgi:hypothetical protein
MTEDIASTELLHPEELESLFFSSVSSLQLRVQQRLPTSDEFIKQYEITGT